MAYAIEPLRADDLPDLQTFLTRGFRAPPDAEFAAPDVLRWKYLDPLPCGDDGPRSWVARDEATGGAIVGHVGVVLTRFILPDRPEPIPALHMIDWLGSKDAPGVGTRLMMRAHGRAPVQYVLGGSDDARRTIARAGYAALQAVTAYRRALRPFHRLRDASSGSIRRVFAVSRDLWSAAAARIRLKRLNVSIDLSPIARFAEQTKPKVEIGAFPLTYADRSPAALNRLLDYPRGGLQAWAICDQGRTLGYALVRFRPDDPSPIRVAKLVDLFLDSDPLVMDPGLIPPTLEILARELAGRGADLMIACGQSPALRAGLWFAGFDAAYKLELHLRDRAGLLTSDGKVGVPPPLVSFLDADYAHTP